MHILCTNSLYFDKSDGRAGSGLQPALRHCSQHWGQKLPPSGSGQLWVWCLQRVSQGSSQQSPLGTHSSPDLITKTMDPHKTQKWRITKGFLKFQRKYTVWLYRTWLPAWAGEEEEAELTVSRRTHGVRHPQSLKLIAWVKDEKTEPSCVRPCTALCGFSSAQAVHAAPCSVTWQRLWVLPVQST